MRFDPDAGSLEVSVRELVYPERRLGVATSFGRLRVELGQAVHARYRLTRDGPGVETEVFVRLEREVDGVRAIIRGRADVVVREEDGWVVEEVKSLLEEASSASAASLDDFRSAALQAQIYALALADEGRAPVAVRVVLADLDGGFSVVPVDFDRAAVEDALLAALRACLGEARQAAARQATRRSLARELRFPHPETRPGQERLGEALAGALRSSRPALIEAPTGTGKTVVALLAALREALGRGAAVWYLTAKTTQRRAVLATFEAIVAASADPPLRAIELRRKEAMCPPGDLACHPDRCRFLADFEARAGAAIDALSAPGARSAEAIFRRGEDDVLCPYELMHALVAGADLVVGDYNHVYDRGQAGAPRMVVVDEAHNLPDRARGYASAFVGKRSLRALAGDAALAALGSQIGAAIDAALAEAAEDEREGYDGRVTATLDAARWRALGLDAGLLALRHAAALHARAEVRISDPVLDVLEAVGKLGELVGADDVCGYVAGPAASSGAGVGVICLDASRRLARHHRRELGLVAMSATLAPLSFYAEVLGIARLDPVLASVPSSFPRENRCVCIVPTIRTTLAEREESAPAVGALIDRVIAVRPGNYAAFFASFRHLAEVRRHLSAPGFEVIVQPPGASEAMRAQVVEKLRRTERPTLLFAVSGGIFAEGIDLPGEALVGAIVVGPALPAADFERRLMQAHHDERHEAGFAYAMAYPGMQRVVQAAGRVHRSADDRGVIVLVGARFAEPPFYDAIPAHFYDHSPDELFCDDPIPRLTRFWSG